MTDEFRAIYGTEEGQKGILFRFDSHPAGDDTQPKPKRIVAALVNLKNVGIVRLVADDLWETLNPLLVAPGENTVSIYRLSTSGTKLEKIKYQQASYIEFYELGKRGQVISAYQFSQAEWVSRTTAAVDTYTLEGLHYRYLADTGNLTDIKIADNGGRARGNRRRVQA